MNDLASIERMIQELMQKREDKLYEIEDRKAEAEKTQQEIDNCKMMSTERFMLMGKRYSLMYLMVIVRTSNPYKLDTMLWRHLFRCLLCYPLSCIFVSLFYDV